MIPFPSKLEVYCINLNRNGDTKIRTKEKVQIGFRKPVKKNISPIEIKKTVVPIKLSALEKKYGKDFATAIKGAEGLAKNQQLHIIDTKKELEKFENANNNSWILYGEKGNKIQFYIRHPKKGKENLLIEAETFYKYVEDQYDYELKNYCMSHCDLKGIHITKLEEKEFETQLKSGKFSGGFASKSKKGNIFHMKGTEPLKRIEPLKEYMWLEKEFMDCINALSKGAKFENSYEFDLTAGISADYVKVISLNAKAHKKYRYIVYVEC